MDLSNILNNSLNEQHEVVPKSPVKSNRSKAVGASFQHLKASARAYIKTRRRSSANYTHTSQRSNFTHSQVSSTSSSKCNTPSISHASVDSIKDALQPAALPAQEISEDEESFPRPTRSKRKRAQSIDTSDEDDEDEEADSTDDTEGKGQAKKNRKKRSKAPNSAWSVEEDNKLVSASSN